jgi:signal peptide peptidase SppA
MLNIRRGLWAGSQAALEFLLEIEEKIMAADIKAGMAAMLGDQPADNDPFTRSGNVAIVAVRGPLVNVDSPFLAFFGVSSYPAIRRSVVAAAQDARIEQILLDIDSPGGSVAGMIDTADLIARVHSKVKPVTSFAGGTMASAATALGVSAGQVFAEKTSITGSIGVIMVHLDRTKQLADAGIKPTVFRGGKYKALLNPYEPLTDAAKAQVEEQIDGAYKVFVQHVADSRGVSYAVADKKMADGREFFGSAGVDAGLVDAISSFDAVVSVLQSKKGVDRRK